MTDLEEAIKVARQAVDRRRRAIPTGGVFEKPRKYAREMI